MLIFLSGGVFVSMFGLVLRRVASFCKEWDNLEVKAIKFDKQTRQGTLPHPGLPNKHAHAHASPITTPARHAHTRPHAHIWPARDEGVLVD